MNATALVYRRIEQEAWSFGRIATLPMEPLSRQIIELPPPGIENAVTPKEHAQVLVQSR